MKAYHERICNKKQKSCVHSKRLQSAHESKKWIISLHSTLREPSMGILPKKEHTLNQASIPQYKSC